MNVMTECELDGYRKDRISFPEYDVKSHYLSKNTVFMSIGNIKCKCFLVIISAMTDFI